MEENDEHENAQSDPPAAPKKIALKVPTLFFKSTFTKKEENGESAKDEPEDGKWKESPRKISRPMPASARKKLEGNQDEPRRMSSVSSISDDEEENENKNANSKVPDEDSDNEGVANRSVLAPEKKETEGVIKPKPRPMPASAKRALGDGSVGNSSKTPSKPMPASAKQKFQNSTPGSPNNNVENDKNKNDLDDISSESSLADEEISDKKEIESSTEKTKTTPVSAVTEKKPKPMPASVRKKLEESSGILKEQSDVKSDDATETSNITSVPDQESKKSNISLGLGGIRLPVFKKSAPPPKNETETKNSKDTDKTKKSDADNIDTKMDLDEDSNPATSVSRRTGRRSDAVGKELLYLEDPQYPCDICGTVFTHKYNWKKHMERHSDSANRDEKKENNDKSKNFSKIRTCPNCGEERTFPNKKSFRDHLRKCKRPQKPCALCDKKFSSEKDLIKHIKTHAGTTNTEENSPGISSQSIFDNHDISIPASPVSPEEIDNEGSEGSAAAGDSSWKKSSSSSMNDSLKHKISQALTNFTNRKVKSKSGGGKDKDTTTDSDNGSGGGKKRSESIQGRPMPASLKKKLEERLSKDGDEDTTRLRQGRTCRVCNQQFFNRHNRVRHEKNVHNYTEANDAELEAEAEPETGEDAESKEPEPEVDTDGIPTSDSDICRVCDKQFSDKWGRWRHERNVHKLEVLKAAIKRNQERVETAASNQSILRCKVCSKMFTSRSNRRKHESRVHNLKPGSNPTTATTTATSSVKTKPSDSKSSASASALLKSNTCRFCGKMFSQIWLVKRHEKEAHMHRLAQISKTSAGKTTTASVKGLPVPGPGLQVRNEKQCRFCGKKFARRYNCKNHERRVHGNLLNEATAPTAPSAPTATKLSKPAVGIQSKMKKRVPSSLECEVCFRRFSSSDNRRRHEKTVHKLLNLRKGSRKREEVLPSASVTVEENEGEEEEQLENEGIGGDVSDRDQDEEMAEEDFSQEDEEPQPQQEEDQEEDDEIANLVNAKKMCDKLTAAQGGRCPLCSKFYANQLRRHLVNIHKMKLSAPPVPAKPAVTSVPSAVKVKEKREAPKVIAKTDDAEEGRRKAKEMLKTLNWKMGGNCPVCSMRVKSQLRLHLKRRHQIKGPAAVAPPKVNSLSVSTSEKPPAPTPTYNAFKSTTDRLKRKLATTTTTTASQKKSSGSSSTPSRQPQPQAPLDLECPCCDEMISVEGSYEEYKAARQPRKKFYIACKICWNMFSHNDDFILHMRFRHKDVESGSTYTPPPKATNSSQNQSQQPSKPKPTSVAKSKETQRPSDEIPPSLIRMQFPSRRSLRKDYVPFESPPPLEVEAVMAKQEGNLRSSLNRKVSSGQVEKRRVSFNDKPPTKKTTSESRECSIVISPRESRLAKNKLKMLLGRKTISKSGKKQSTHSTIGRSRPKSPSPPVQEDYGNDDYDNGPMYDDDDDDVGESPPSPMEVDAEIAITSTFTQKQSIPEKKKSSNAYGLMELPCSTCKEAFYSFEALRKHELYFHNVKTSNMCPICGTFPNRLSRHLMAHENKTVKCSCVQCALDYEDFSQLREHNMRKHPKPEPSRSRVAPITQQKTFKSLPPLMDEKQQVEKGFYRCKVCDREFDEELKAKTHVRKDHGQENYLDDYVEKIQGARNGGDADMENILQETNKKLTGSDWGDSDAESAVASKPAPPGRVADVKKSRAMPASVRAKLEAEQSNNSKQGETAKRDGEPIRKRPMPASIRAKLESQGRKSFDEKMENSDTESSVKDSHVQSKSKPSRPMPASARAKLMVQEEAPSPSSVESGQSASRPNKRPMPASARAKLMAQDETVENSFSSPLLRADLEQSSSTSKPAPVQKPSKPMPASVRAKLKNKAELKEVLPSDDDEDKESEKVKSDDDGDADYVPSEPPSPAASVDIDISDVEDTQIIGDIGKTGRDSMTKPNTDDNSVEEVVVLSDEDDNNGDVVMVEGTVSSPNKHRESTAEEIAEHDRAVRIAMGDLVPGQTPGCNIRISYQCKLCAKSFDTVDSIRKHIYIGHREYQAEHTENLIEQIYEETTTEVTEDPARKRRRTTRYTEEEYLDAHDELEEDDEEAEVIVRRGTSTRRIGFEDQQLTRAKPPASTASRPKEKPSPEACRWACEFCGKRMDSSGNVRRHIHKAHPVEYKEGLNGVIDLDAGEQPPHQQAKGTGFRCRICHWKLERYGSMYAHIKRSHPETSAGNISSYMESIPEPDGGNTHQQPISWGGEMENEVTTFSCILCNYFTSEEHDYVRHYKKHTGVSPYQCQYCAGTFNRNQQLLSHIQREHTGAEFLNEDEEEFSMEDMRGTNEIQVSATIPIQIEQPQMVTLSRTNSTENEVEKKVEVRTNGHPATDDNDDDDESEQEEAPIDPITPAEPKRRPGPASKSKPLSRPTKIERADTPPPQEESEPELENPSTPSPDAEVSDDEKDNEEEEAPIPVQKTASLNPDGSYQYQGDLSSLFSTLGGEGAPGGLDAIDDLGCD